MNEVIVVEDVTQVTVVIPGIQGPAGASGTGVPAGGATGQVLTKKSNADGDADWEASGGGGGGISEDDAVALAVALG